MKSCVGGSRRRGCWGISSRHRARPLSTQTRGPYAVHPCSCCSDQHPCWIQAAGKRYPSNLADASTYAESASHSEWLFQTTCFFGDVRPLGVYSRIVVIFDLGKKFCTREGLRIRRVTPSSAVEAEAGEGCALSGSLSPTGMLAPAAAPGMDGIRSTRLRGQGSCAVPESAHPAPASASHRRLLNNGQLTN